MAPPSRFETVRDGFWAFIDYLNSKETLVGLTSMYLVIITITDLLSFFIVYTEPVTFFCNGFFRTFSVLEVIALTEWFISLLAISLMHIFDKIESESFVNHVHLLHSVGYSWLPPMILQWNVCVSPTKFLGRLLGIKFDFTLNYAPWTLNACLHPTSCYNYYLSTHVGMITFSIIVTSFFAIYVYLAHKLWMHRNVEPAVEMGAVENRGRNRLREIDQRRRRSANADNNSGEVVPLLPVASRSPEIWQENSREHDGREDDPSGGRLGRRVISFLADCMERESVV